MPTRRARLAAYLVPLALLLVPVDIQRCCPPAPSPATDVQRAQWRFPWSPCRGVRGCPRYFCRPCPSKFPSSRVGTRPCPHTSTCTRTCTSRVASVPSLLPVCRLSPPQGRTFHCLVSALTPVRSRAAIKAGAPHALASPTPARPLPPPPPFHLLLYCTSVFCSSLPWHPAQAATPYSAAALRATASRDPKPDSRHHLGPCARRVPRRVLPDPTTTPCVVARPSKTWSLLFALRASSSYDRSTSVGARDTRLKQAPRPFAARSTILRISPLAAKPPRRSESSPAVASAPSRLSRSPEPYLQISALPTPLDRLIRPTSGV